MELDIQEISKIIKNRLDDYEVKIEGEEVGLVLESGDGIAHIGGLPNAMLGEMIEFPNNKYGIVFNLEMDEIVVIILGRHTEVKEGAWAKCTKRIMQVPVGDVLLGRVVNAIGEPIDGKGPIRAKNFRPVEKEVPGVIDRSPVDEPLQTGYKAIDAMVPIGRGQRELIVGDRKTGKTILAIDTIINQKNTGVICIYVAIGQKSSSIVEVVETLIQHQAMDYTIVIDASANDPAAMQYLAPFSGVAMAEEFMEAQKKDVLIVYDDLTKHANAYRTISLLLQRPPGREAFPGDVFYLHSRLLERSAKLNEALGGGSITALPIIETQKGDISTYIPTNVISITDGQIFLQTDLFHAGIRPAINVGVSVSRVGGKAQVSAMRKLSGRLRLELARYREKASFTAFSSELDAETQLQLKRGQIVTEILKQEKQDGFSVDLQIISIYLAINGYLDALEIKDIKAAELFVLDRIKTKHGAFLKKFVVDYQLTPELETELKEILSASISAFTQKQN